LFEGGHLRTLCEPSRAQDVDDSRALFFTQQGSHHGDDAIDHGNDAFRGGPGSTGIPIASASPRTRRDQLWLRAAACRRATDFSSRPTTKHRSTRDANTSGSSTSRRSSRARRSRESSRPWRERNHRIDGTGVVTTARPAARYSRGWRGKLARLYAESV